MKTEAQDLFDKLQADLDRLKEIVSNATLIEDEKIMVGENEVVFVGEYAFINDFGFSRGHIKLLLPLNPIFQKILDRLEK